MHSDAWWHAGWMWLFWIIVLVAIVLVVASAARGTKRPEESPEEILKKRHARGEISKEQYDKMLADLRAK